MRRLDGKQRGSPPREVCHRDQTWSSMTTEYQEMFLHPHCRTAVTPNPLLRTAANNTTAYKTKLNPTENQPQPQWRNRKASHNPIHSAGNQVLSKEENFTSVYQNDFREWKAIKQQPCKVTDNLKVRQGLVPVGASRGLLVQEPFQSITSYRFHYPIHPLQNRTGQRTSTNQQDYNNFMQHFKRWSLGTKIHSQAGTKDSCKAAAVRRDTKPVSSCLSTGDKKHKSWKTTLKENTKTSLGFIPNAEQAPKRCT